MQNITNLLNRHWIKTKIIVVYGGRRKDSLQWGYGINALMEVIRTVGCDEHELVPDFWSQYLYRSGLQSLQQLYSSRVWSEGQIAAVVPPHIVCLLLELWNAFGSRVIAVTYVFPIFLKTGCTKYYIPACVNN